MPPLCAARGRDVRLRPSRPDRTRRSRSDDRPDRVRLARTDTADQDRLEATLLDLAESVASRLRHHGLVASAVQLKLRYEGFETLTRQAPLTRQVHDSSTLYDAGVALLHRTLVPGRGVRLLGLTAIGLASAQQLTLFDAPQREARLARSIDAVRERFGERAITRARLLRQRPQRRFDFGERPPAPSQDEEPDGP